MSVRPSLDSSSTISSILSFRVHQSLLDFLYPSLCSSLSSSRFLFFHFFFFAVQQTQMLAQHLCKLASWRGEVTETLREHSPGPRVCASACPSSSSSSSRSPPTAARMRLGCTDSTDFLSDGCKTRANLELTDKVWGKNNSLLLLFMLRFHTK